MKKSIAVLITVFNRKEKTLHCLEDLFLQKLDEGYYLDVYLVDDGSTDGTSESVKQQFPKVNLIKGNGGLFWNRGMRLAWETANRNYDYDHYLWINDDTFLNDGALSQLLENMVHYEEKVIVVGSTSAIDDDSKITYGGWSSNDQLIIPNSEPQRASHFNGNIVLVSKYAFKMVGFNDLKFHHALGDFDYGKRASKMGIKIIIAPGSLGRCDLHERLQPWCDPNVSLKKRWQNFRSPLGNNPEEFFVYKYRHYGLFQALYNYFTNHVRVLCPSLWNSRNKKSLKQLS